MALEEPQIRLVIDQRPKNSDAPSTTHVWNPGETLRGHLELSSKGDIDISDVSIYFEGISRNWITQVRELQLDSTIWKVERKFLSQVQNFVSADISRTDRSPDQSMYKATFHFNIPKTMPRLKPSLPEHCLQLPPSLELGELLVDKVTGERFAQPSIKYSLRSLITFRNREESGSKTIETARPVIIAPYTEEFPPTETEDFPAEFKEQDSKILRRHLMAGALGELTVSVREPPALRYEVQARQARTSASAKLEFNSQSSIQMYQILQGLSFTVFSLVRIKTFYSLQTFPRLPSQSLLSVHGTTRMRDEMIKLETRTLRDVSWRYIYESGNQTQGSKLSASPAQGKWTAMLGIPIKSDTRLLPTFCTSVVARLYTLIVRVKVGGVRTESFDLEVPLQVIHSFPKGHPSAYGENFEQEAPFEQFRRVSESSWLSEESLESSQDPPGYYP